MRILMPVDGSDYSRAAVAFVASRATLLEHPTDIALVNVQYPVPPRAARALGKAMVTDWHDSEAAKVLKPAATNLKRAGATVTARYLVGNVANELAALAASDPADLIVMGSHGKTGLKKLLFGSATNTVVASCSKPMLILRATTVPRRDSLKVGIALDGSPYALAVVDFVAEHRGLFGRSPAVSLIHVVPDLAKITVAGWIEREIDTGLEPSEVRAMQEAGFASVFEPAHDRLRRAGIAASEVRLIGNATGELIAAYASKSKLDVLAMGSLGFGASGRVGIGSVATRAAASCGTALLLLREKARALEGSRSRVDRR